MSKIPFLFVSDSISSASGLGGRITRELSTRLYGHCSDIFDVATAGYGGTYSKRFPFPQYPFQKMENWLVPELPGIWLDHAGDRRGIVMFIWNASWLPWVADPSIIPDIDAYRDLKTWLKSGLFEKWIYAPVDSVGPNGKLSDEERRIFLGFDRVLAYTKFGADLINETIGLNGESLAKIEYIPHGIDERVFYPRDRNRARELFTERVVGKESGKISPDITLLGVVATNTPRKDYGLCFEICRELLDRRVNLGLWCHTDRFRKNWDLLAMAESFGMKLRTVFTNQHLSDESMAIGYAACDCTLGIGSGEGWGSPIGESLAMGVPCVTGNYAGATQYTPPGMLVQPVAFRWDGYYTNSRPVFRAVDWAQRIMNVLPLGYEPRLSLMSPRYDWKNLWLEWEEWFRQGAERFQDDRASLAHVLALNYDHHRRMTEDHHRIKAEEAKHPETANTREKLDDDAYRVMLANIPKGGKILELGSASGGQWPVLREWSLDITGVDLYEPAVKKSQKEGLNIHLAFVESMPFPDETFDLVCSRHVMEHVAGVSQALKEIWRVLKPGGYVVNATPHYFPDIEPAHINQFKIDEWVKLYEKAGFKVIEAEVRKVFNPEAHIVARK